MNFKDNIIITPNNDFSYLKEEYDILNNREFSVKDIYGNDINHFATGSAVTVTEDSGTTEEFTVVVTGDINGDGVCDVLDATHTERIANGYIEPSDLQVYAANGCVSEGIDLLSYQNVVNIALSN